jgi:Fanconi anemia group M protein
LEAKIQDNQYLDQDQLEFREYQLAIAQKCVNKNSLVVVPTGLGKTIIGLFVAAETLKLYPKGSKILVLAPTRPLINQHYETFLKLLTIPEEQFCILTGKIQPKDRPAMFENNQIIFATPQTIRNDVVKKKYSLQNTCLVIFDEAHHASGDYPYTLISDIYVDQNPDGTILGLTASPGSSRDRINELCENLHIPIENIHIRTRKDTDVKSYLKPMDIYKIGTELTDLMKNIKKVLYSVLDERLMYLEQKGFLERKNFKEPFHKQVFRKNLLALNQDLISIINGDGDKTGVYSSISVNAQALILYHMLELVDQQGLDILYEYFEKMRKDAKKKNSSKTIRILAGDNRLGRVYLELRKQLQFSPESLIHPKFLVLKELLKKEIEKNPHSRILVFVKLRASVRIIVKKLKKLDSDVKAVRFVGQANKSRKDKGLTQKQQIEILDKFKQGKFNVLVSTNVGEEGLDVAECDLVIFYDVVASEIRLIQRKGRTARHRKGRVIILYCKDTQDEIYMNIAMNKLRRMNFNLKNKGSLRKNVEITSGKNIQSNLVGFSKNIEHSKPTKKLEVANDVILSVNLDMTFGIRKKLKDHSIDFSVKSIKVDIKLFDKVGIKILKANTLDLDSLKRYSGDDEYFELIIVAIDFLKYIDKIQGEKRFLKEKLTRLGKDLPFQIVFIDNREELFFIIRSIVESEKGKKKTQSE